MAVCSCSSHDSPDEPVHRTVLVYMVATNNLHSDRVGNEDEDYDHLDLAEMQEAAAAGGLLGGRLLIYHAVNGSDARLLEITDKGALKTLYTFTDGNSSVSSARMADAIDKAKKYAPALDYGIVLWSHGSGWLEDGLEPAGEKRSFGLQGVAGTMNTSTLARVLEGQGFSFIYFDCCLMGCIEVVYELRRCAPYIVGSASELPVYGMDYTLNIPCFFRHGEADLQTAARNTFDSYNNRSDQMMRTCTISVIETAKLDALADAMRQVFASVDFPATLSGTPQKYIASSSYYYDLGDYLDKLPADPGAVDKAKTTLAQAVTAAHATDYLWRGTWQQVRINKHCGLSTFIVNQEADITRKNYFDLQWYADVVYAMTAKDNDNQ